MLWNVWNMEDKMYNKGMERLDNVHRKTRKGNKIMSMKKGAASLYIVIFTTMLLSIISLGFVRIMFGEQSAARNQDLSNSAYDSAMAGVEDAKVVILAYQECASKGAFVPKPDGSFPDITVMEGVYTCSRVRQALSTPNCDTIRYARGTFDDTVHETNLNDGMAANDADATNDLNQAYTCVTVTPDTPDYLALLSPSQPSLIVPLRFHEDVDTLVIRWWRSADTDGADPFIGNRCNAGGTGCFPTTSIRNNDLEPPVIRWQLINPGSGWTLDSLNNENAQASLFFVPTTGVSVGASNTRHMGNSAVEAEIVTRSGQAIRNVAPYNDITFNTNFTGQDSPQGGLLPWPTAQGINLGGHTPLPILCYNHFNQTGNSGYACSVQINLPTAMRIPANSANALLRLTAYYGTRATSISVEGRSRAAGGGNLGVQRNFNSVQPEIDSTGRASDLFRRVIARVDLADAWFPFPEYALELRDSGANLCKNFLVWDTGSTNLDTSNCN